VTNNLARLRIVSAEAGDTGSAASRDATIAAFLGELESVVSELVIDRISDTGLRSLYVSWVNQLTAGLDAHSRLVWLAEGVIISPSAAGRAIQPPSEPTGNVINLHARY